MLKDVQRRPAVVGLPQALRSVIILLCFSACSGSVTGADQADEPHAGGPGGQVGGGVGAPSACETQGEPKGWPMRRLSHVEYKNTLRHLFPNIQHAKPELPEDNVRHWFENDAQLLGTSNLLVEQYAQVAHQVAAKVAAASATFTGCAEEDAARVECGVTFMEGFLNRAFRRPATDVEKAQFGSFFREKAATIDFEAALELTVASLLQSAPFLYRIETSGGVGVDGDDRYAQLNDFEIANRLSYLLWQSMPDDELFGEAAAGRLSDPEVRRGQVMRMLADPKTGETLVDFHRQYWQFDRHEKVNKPQGADKDPNHYKLWNSELEQSIREESDRFVRDVVFEQQGGLRDLLLSHESWVNPALAKLYGVTADGSGWSKTQLPQTERAGYFTRANFLAGHAKAVNGSPPLRGVAIMERLFCLTPASPPEDADISNPALTNDGQEKTNRQKFEDRVAPPTCNGCHRVFDPLGHVFEHYDGIGAYRTKEANGLSVDASVLVEDMLDVDGSFQNAIEFSSALASSGEVARCYAQNLFEFLVSRVSDEADACRIESIAKTLANEGSVMAALATLALSPESTLRVVPAN